MIASTRRQLAPIPDGRPHPPMLLSVDVEEGEDIEWIWTHHVDGSSYVSDYRIVPRMLTEWLRQKEHGDG